MRKANQSATFKHLADYVETATEAANDPMFGWEAIQKVGDGSKASKAKELGCRDKTPRLKSINNKEIPMLIGLKIIYKTK